MKAAQGISNKTISLDLGLCEDSVGLWRRRWLSGQAALKKAAGNPKALRVAIESLLTDKARPGSPGKFSAEQICQIIALACEKPPEQISHWTRNDLVRESMRRGIVETISATTIGEILKSGGSQATSQPILAESRSRG
ncbi:helix-turn-helix domain-containing protein [Methylobacter sp. BlB1]|uniref:helix-turn-helix domain-containing protein n=1 Tax=Methylobacter sp. BlB1 TaxID=2785914 RepID=UPI001E4ED63B|nr:helix-turn-helix domain-containing protein [Methylobacter sp. BlB1]